MGQLISLYRDLTDSRTLGIFLGLDAFAIGLNVALVVAYTQNLLPFPNSLLRVNADHSLGEFINYAKWLMIFLAFRAVYKATGIRLYAALSWVFLLIGLDDFLRLHEQLGDMFAQLLSYTDGGGLRDDDKGELTTWALMGLFVVALLWHGFRSAPANHRRIGYLVLVLSAILVFFAVVFDIGYFWINRAIGMPNAISITEDGGEMVAASLNAGLAVGIRKRFAPKDVSQSSA